MKHGWRVLLLVLSWSLFLMMAVFALWLGGMVSNEFMTLWVVGTLVFYGAVASGYIIANTS